MREVKVLVAPDVAAIVSPAWAVVEPVDVVARDTRQDEPLRAASAALRTQLESSVVSGAVRHMYKQMGIDPTKTRPSSEALLRRLRKGEQLPRINSLVDIINWCSVESQLPFGLYDLDLIRGEDIAVRLGRLGEAYAGIRKDAVHLDGRLVLADAEGPFGNPTSDSGRTMVTAGTKRALVVIYAPAALDRAIADRALAATLLRVRTYATR